MDRGRGILSEDNEEVSKVKRRRVCKKSGNGSVAFSGSLGCRGNAHDGSWNSPSEYGPQGELFSFLMWKEPTSDGERVDFGSDGPLDTEVYEEHNVGNLSLEVVEQGWSGWLINLCLEDWELARVAVSCHLALDFLCQKLQDARVVVALLSFCCPLLQCFLKASPIMEGLGCDGRETSCK